MDSTATGPNVPVAAQWKAHLADIREALTPPEWIARPLAVASMARAAGDPKQAAIALTAAAERLGAHAMARGEYEAAERIQNAMRVTQDRGGLMGLLAVLEERVNNVAVGAMAAARDVGDGMNTLDRWNMPGRELRGAVRENAASGEQAFWERRETVRDRTLGRMSGMTVEEANPLGYQPASMQRALSQIDAAALESPTTAAPIALAPQVAAPPAPGGRGLRR
jgi:hypothetical protein